MMPNETTIAAMIACAPDSLGSHGPSVARLLTVLADEGIDAATVVQALEDDLDLSMRVLRFANSASLGLAQTVGTLQDAVALIGFERVGSLVVSAHLIQAFAGCPQDQVSMESFWHHSIAVAIGSRAIARIRGFARQEDYFLGGLAHDVGRLVLFQQAPETSARLLRLHQDVNRHRATVGGTTLQHIESMSLGFDHQSVGELLLRRWGLPAVMQPCAGFHHSPTKGPGGLAASVVHVADHLANAMRTGTSGELLAPPLSRLAWDMVGLSVDDLAVVMEEIDLEVDSHRCMLSP